MLWVCAETYTDFFTAECRKKNAAPEFQTVALIWSSLTIFLALSSMSWTRPLKKYILIFSDMTYFLCYWISGCCFQTAGVFNGAMKWWAEAVSVREWRKMQNFFSNSALKKNLQSEIAVLEFCNSWVITQIRRAMALIPMECKNSGKAW